ncbi:MAG: N-acetylmuramoyl-L-alanine amidase [Drouetiella hepatica Uher 2000/2452]|uniref:N-acetylmuramoyl-L-alanine amidase n=1 Tax=Drouetiella hepatica Uher 2000/2452 TaxID=904376 RepID=A0A951UNP2_9CYAN|nr:N-acetylmuramoyl-L-alanine amidase [Drouetiella hepatica Uher 2000/2452]
MMGTIGITSAAWAEQPLFVSYPPDGHETTSAQIFLIGTAPAQGEVTVNGMAIDRSPAGHFAPSLPLQVGENLFTLKYQNQAVTLRVKRLADSAAVPVGTFAEGSLTPAVDIARLPREPICFGAIAPPNAQVAVTLNQQTIPLFPQSNISELPPNSAVLTLQNQPTLTTAQSYQGCITGELWYEAGNVASSSGGNRLTSLDLGYPLFQLALNGETVREQGKGKVEILSPATLPVVEVITESGTARTGASTDYSRLTPLPKGTRAAVTAQEGEWLRLDYGGWIKAAETQIIPNAVLPQTLIRSVRASQEGDWTEIAFPLQVPVPLSVQQGDRTFTLTLYNTTAQTDIIALETDPAIARLDWQQIAPGQVQYTFQLKTQPWGYKLRYEGTTLILSLKHLPQLTHQKPLSGVSILLDPGHGGPEDLGSRGPTGYPEKDVTLIMANLVRDRLIAQGATVYMTREGDVDLYPNDRANLINQMEPTIAISLHYNALPDSGDARNTRGVSTFWYNTQAHSLADSLHNMLVTRLDRPSYGIFWDNLALTRPTVAPAVLLELGFMTNPEEFEWITNPQEQEKLADAIAEGITQWIEETRH